MAKYKVAESTNDPVRVGDEINLVSSSRVPRPPRPKRPTTNSILLDFVKEQREFNSNILNRFDSLETDVKSINKRFDNLIKVNNLKE